MTPQSAQVALKILHSPAAVSAPIYDYVDYVDDMPGVISVFGKHEYTGPHTLNMLTLEVGTGLPCEDHCLHRPD